MNPPTQEARGKSAKVLGLLAGTNQALRTASVQAAVLRAHVARDPCSGPALGVLAAIEALAAEAAALGAESSAEPAPDGSDAHTFAPPVLQAAKLKAGRVLALLAQRQERLAGQRRTVALLARILGGSGPFARSTAALGAAPAWLEAEAEEWRARVARLRREAAVAVVVKGAGPRVCC